MKCYLLEGRITKADRERGVFYVLSEQGTTQRLYWLGYQLAGRTHRRRISKLAYDSLRKLFINKGRPPGRSTNVHRQADSLRR